MFNWKKPTFLGIDFGMSHIKAVELTVKDDRPYVINYGEIAIDAPVAGDALLKFDTPEEKMKFFLKSLLERMNPKSEVAYVAMPGSGGLIAIVDLPKMSESELENAVRFEAQRYIPSPLSEVVLSWDVVSKGSGQALAAPRQPAAVSDGPEMTEVLLVAALHKEVEKYERYVFAADLKVEMLELETFSLVRSLASDDSVIMIVDIGSRATNLLLAENGFIRVNRNVNAGGREITATLSDALNISWERAEVMKVGETDFLNNRESVIVFPSLELVVNEARRMIDAYRERHQREAHIDRIILSGGVAKMQGLAAYFSNAMGIPSVVGNPWEKVSYDEKLSDTVASLGSSYSVALGLALAGFESHIHKR